MREKIGSCCTTTLTMLLRHLVNTYTFLLDTIEIVVQGQPDLAGRLQKTLLKWVVGA
ncbi:hypothetical protein D3C81_1954010 [compost metagenome]